MKAVLMSGSFKKITIPQNIVNFINNNLSQEKNISFIASSFKEFEGNDKFVNKLLIAFKQKGIFFDNHYIIDSRISKDDMIDKINHSSIVFLLGGDTLKQIKSIKHYGLTKYICDENKIIIGISAGAINMAGRVVLAKDLEDNIPNLSIYNGLGIININIEPHCEFNNKVHWKDLEEASMYTDLVVMHDDAYIILDDNNIKFFGHYLVLKKGRIYYQDKECSLIDFLKEIDYD